MVNGRRIILVVLLNIFLVNGLLLGGEPPGSSRRTHLSAQVPEQISLEQLVSF